MSSNKDIVFLGGLFPREMEEEIYASSIGTVQNAANVLQWKIVNGLDSNINKPVKIINSMYIGSYPKRYKKLFIPTREFNHIEGAVDINVGYINLFGVKHIFRYNSLKKHLKNWALDGKPNKAIVAYALTDTFVRALQYVKTINPDINTTIVVPDLPQYMNTSNHKSVLYDTLKKLEIKRINKNKSSIDSYILLTRHMKDYINTDNYIVIEGIASDEFNNIDRGEKEQKVKTILYTGTLHQKYGILNLINAFKLINRENYQLVICGDGDSKEQVIEESKKDKRIVYKGLLNRKEVLKLQVNSTILINPRQNNEEFTKYSFPSKIIEYLSSGTPVVAYKLDGIPDEYDKYIMYIEDNTIEALKNKIVETCEKDFNELNKIGKSARSFVLNQKNPVVQGRKILELLSNSE